MKHIIPILCVVGYFWSFPVYEDCPMINRILYMFSHANIFHLAINIFSYYMIVKYLKFLKWWLIPLFLVTGIVGSFGAISETVGMSGALFGLLGFHTAYYKIKGCDIRKQLLWTAIYILVSFLLPHISGGVHLIGFLTGIIIGITYGGIFSNRGHSGVLAV